MDPFTQLIADTLSATTTGGMGGEPVTDVYRPEGLAVLVAAALRKADRGLVATGLGMEQVGWQWFDPVPGNVSGGLMSEPGLLRGDSRLKPVYRFVADTDG